MIKLLLLITLLSPIAHADGDYDKDCIIDKGEYYQDMCAYAVPKLYKELSDDECREYGGFQVETDIEFDKNTVCLVD